VLIRRRGFLVVRFDDGSRELFLRSDSSGSFSFLPGEQDGGGLTGTDADVNVLSLGLYVDGGEGKAFLLFLFLLGFDWGSSGGRSRYPACPDRNDSAFLSFFWAYRTETSCFSAFM